MSSRTNTGLVEFRVSDLTSVGASVTHDISVYYPHTFIGVEFFDDAGGTLVTETDIVANGFVTPTAGTVTTTAKTYVNPSAFDAITSGTIDATAPTTVSIGTNASQVMAAPVGIVGATHYRLRISQNKT